MRAKGGRIKRAMGGASSMPSLQSVAPRPQQQTDDSGNDLETFGKNLMSLSKIFGKGSSSGTPSQARGGRIRRADGGAANADQFSDNPKVNAEAKLNTAMDMYRDANKKATTTFSSKDLANARTAGQRVDIAQDQFARALVPGTAEKLTTYPKDQPEGYPTPRRGGGRLTAAQRQAMPRSSFALPGKGSGPKGSGPGSYPIPDKSHARNALSRVAQHGSSAQKAAVRAKVHAKFPDIGRGK